MSSATRTNTPLCLVSDWDFSLRRLIGRRFDDPTVKKDIESWPFKIIDDNGSPRIQVEYLNETKSFSAQEISSMVLTKVRFYHFTSPTLLLPHPRTSEH